MLMKIIIKISKKLLRYAVRQWSTFNELAEPDHDQLFERWLDGDCKEWIKNNMEHK